MTVALTLLRKHLAESRWVLGISAAALFAFGWLGVYFIARGQRQMRDRGAQEFIRRMMSSDGGEITTGMIEVAFWVHPFVWLPIIAWAISRGSLAIAGELERGTLDLILSRPVRRSTYLLSQAATGVVGLLVLGAALVVGNLVGTAVHGIDGPPSALALSRPGLNLAALGFCVFGVTLFFSSLDIVRWRSNLIASALAIASFAAWVIASTVPVLRGTDWEKWLYRVSIFTAYNPVDAIGRALVLGRHLAVLGGIGSGGILLGLLVFAQRDLPSSAG